MSNNLYTLVQHSGVTTGHKEFLRSVELRGVSPRRAETVLAAGGMVFTDYDAASTAEEQENYPPEVTGFIANVRGEFTKKVTIDGSMLYLPKRCTCGARDHASCLCDLTPREFNRDQQ